MQSDQGGKIWGWSGEKLCLTRYFKKEGLQGLGYDGRAGKIPVKLFLNQHAKKSRSSFNFLH